MRHLRSLGTIEYPRAEITSFNGGMGKLTITLSTYHKKIKIVLSVGCLRTIVKLAREGTNKQRAYALQEWRTYKSLQSATGSTPPEGETDA
jgi:hypothetical protein